MAELLWCEVKVAAEAAKLELVAEAFQAAGSGGVVYDDPAILNSRLYTADEVFSDELLQNIADTTGVKAYFPVDDRLGQRLTVLKTQLGQVLGRTPQLQLRQIREDDWSQAWKAYFKPEKIGKVVVKPSWEEYRPTSDEVLVELDPGMAFGTGNHPTTRLCLELLQELVSPPCAMLDLGTGSGILALAGAKLGAAPVTAADIDPVAVRVARANVAANQLAEIVAVTEADLLQGMTGARYDLVVANIIAAVILNLIPEIPGVLKAEGIFLASGIIEERCDEVKQALTAAGLIIKKVARQDGWVAVVAQRGPVVSRKVQS